MLKQSQLISKAVPTLKTVLSRNPPKLLPSYVRDALPPPRKSLGASILIPILHIKQQTLHGDGDDGDCKKIGTSATMTTTTTTTHTCVPSILFTKRSSHLKDHPSQISFPGGHIDDDLDQGCAIRAAIRETREELLPNNHYEPNPNDDGENHDDVKKDDSSIGIGIGISDGYNFEEGLEVIGRTESIPSIRNVPVTPIIACFREEFTNDQVQALFPGNESEVAEVFTLTIEELLDMEGEEPLKRLGMTGPVYKSKYGKIWGLTALVLKPILDQILVPTFLQEREKDDTTGNPLNTTTASRL